MADVDPRFDPRFQRGYDPDVHGAPRVVEAPVEAPPRVAPPQPAVSRVLPEPSTAAAELPPVTAASVGPPLRSEPASRAEPRRPAPIPEDELDDARRPRNPYRIALLALAVVQLAAAGVLVATYFQGTRFFTGSATQFEYMLFMLGERLIPPLIVGGSVALIGWVAVGAMAAERRHADE